MRTIASSVWWTLSEIIARDDPDAHIHIWECFLRDAFPYRVFQANKSETRAFSIIIYVNIIWYK